MLRYKKNQQLMERKLSTKWLILILCAFAGMIYISLIFGTRNINPNNTDWVIKGGGDYFQHYIGWRFFRISPWTKHFLFMQNLNYPEGSSVIVTDSNPLFCLVFKLFRSFLPQNFQFNGIWILLNYGLIGFFSGCIGWKLSRDRLFTCTLSIFTILNPVILQRTAIHDTLTAHWLILYAILAALNWKSRHNWLHWSIITVFVMLIHSYFLPMVSFILLLQLLWMVQNRDKWIRILLIITSFFIPLTLIYFIAGFNYILPQSSSYGELSMNLNAFFNPDGSSVFLPNRKTFPLQYEGFNYLGFGLIVLIIFSLFHLKPEQIKKVLIFIFPVVLYLLFALSNTITFDQKVLATFPLSTKMEQLLSTFRSSGRFAWPFYYLFLFGSGFLIYQKVTVSKRRLNLAKIIIIVCLGLQIADLSEFNISFYNRFHQEKSSEVQEFSIDIPMEAFPSVKHLAVTDGDSRMIDRLALFAVENDLSFNRSANARKIYPIYGRVNDSVHDQLVNRALQRDTIYIIINDEDKRLAVENYPNDFYRTEYFIYIIKQ